MQNAASSYIWATKSKLWFEYENVSSKFAIWQEDEAYLDFTALLDRKQWVSPNKVFCLTKNEKKALQSKVRLGIHVTGSRQTTSPTVTFPDVQAWFGPTPPFFPQLSQNDK